MSRLSRTLRALVLAVAACCLSWGGAFAAGGPFTPPPRYPTPPEARNPPGVSGHNPTPLLIDARTHVPLDLPSQAPLGRAGSGAGAVYPPNSPGPLVYHGGSVPWQGAGVYNLYWGALPQNYQANMQAFESNLSSQQWQSGGFSYDYRGVIPQYYDNWGQGNNPIQPYLYVSSNDVDGNPLPNGCSDPWFAHCVTGGQIETELVNYANAHGWSMTNGSIFVMHLGPGIGVDNGFMHSWCAYHAWDGQRNWIVLPDAAQNGPTVNGSYPTCDAGQRPITGNHTHGTVGDFEASVNLFSHEAAETVTDTYGTAWNANAGGEIGDLCQWQFGTAEGRAGYLYTMVANGVAYYAQLEYSNQAGGCVNAAPKAPNSYPW